MTCQKIYKQTIATSSLDAWAEVSCSSARMSPDSKTAGEGLAMGIAQETGEVRTD